MIENNNWFSLKNKLGLSSVLGAILIVVGGVSCKTKHYQYRKELSSAQAASEASPTTTSSQAASPPVPILNSRGDPGVLGPVPAIQAPPKVRRNLLVIVSESLRADAVCSPDATNCTTAPFTHRLLPQRIAFPEMRAHDSQTALSWMTLLTGLLPSATKQAMLDAPMVWEYARAAGWDTAFFTGQMLAFGNNWVFVRDIPARVRANGIEIEPGVDNRIGAWEKLLVKRIQKDWPTLKEPFLAVVQLSNTHYPYRVDPQQAPFQPYGHRKGIAANDQKAFYNLYLNSVYQQDHAIAELIKFVQKSPVGDRTLILFTADHGEAFREHGQLGHSFTVHEEVIHVPAWIHAPPSTLTVHERALLSQHRAQPRYLADILPTILDLLEIKKHPDVQVRLRSLSGISLLEPSPKDRTVLLTNCTEHWGCVYPNWGIIRYPFKLAGRAGWGGWHCWNVQNDPKEQHKMPPESCKDLKGIGNLTFGGAP
jgi:glucan phosphoethanolaminetransferase (alkaline phosphatase superfamily)